MFAFLVSITLYLFGLPIDGVKADPPEPSPGTVTDIITKLQPYQTSSPAPSSSDSRSVANAPSLPGIAEPLIGTQDQLTAYAVADATILQGYPSLNFGSTTDMWAGYDDSLDPDGEIARSLIQFDITSIPPGEDITTATLRVYLVSARDYPDTSRTITTYHIMSSWLENGVTWNNQPNYGEAYDSRDIVNGAWGWYEFDVTELVRAWYEGTYINYGIMLRGPEVSGLDSSWRSFSTREGLYIPQLVIEYGTSTPTPTPTRLVAPTRTPTPVVSPTDTPPPLPSAEPYTCGSPVPDQLVYLPLILKGGKGGSGPPSAPSGSNLLGVKSYWPYISMIVGDHELLVNLSKGNLLIGHLDQDIPAPGIDGILLRTYNSQSPYTGDFGNAWTSSVGNTMRLESQADGSVIFFGPSGKIERFVPQAGGFISPPGFHYTLQHHGDDTYTMTSISDGTRFNFSSQGQLISISDRNGNTQSYQRDGTGNVTKIVDSVGQNTNIVYNGTTTLITEIEDRAGRVSQYNYTSAGDLESYVNPAGHTTEYHYDSCGKLAELIDAGNNTWSFDYDSQGRVILIIDPLDNEMQFTYQGNTTFVTDANGFNTLYKFDAQGKLIERTDANGNRFRFTWDQFFNMTRVTSPLNHQTQFGWNGNTGLLATLIDALGNRVSYAYDANNNLSSITDARNNVTGFSYDSAGANLLKVTQADGSKITFTYDSQGNPLTVTDPNGNAGDPSNPTGIPYRFTYNAYGYLTDAYDPLGNHWTYTWDNNKGNMLSLRDAKGQLTQYSYDTLDRMTNIVYDDGETVGFAYDNLSNLTSVNDSRGTTSYTYDDVGQLLTQDDPRSPGKMEYSYDPAGNLIKITRYNGHVLTFNYDPANRLVSQSNPFDGDKLIVYLYDADDRLIDIIYPNGDQTTYSYYENDWLQSLLTTAADGIIYDLYTYPSQAAGGYDSNGNPLEFTRSFAIFNDDGDLDWTTETWKLDYDAMDRAVQQDAYDAGGVWQWGVSASYNPNGLFTNQSYQFGAISQSWDYSYDAASRWVEFVTSDGLRHVIINDANGNQTQIKEEVFTGLTSTEGVQFSTGLLNETTVSPLVGMPAGPATDSLISTASIVTNTTTFEYDAADRLAKVTDPEGNWYTFDYDGFDRIAEIDHNLWFSPKKQYYDLLGMARETQGSAAANYLYDLAGNVRANAEEGFPSQYLHRDPRGQISHVSDDLVSYSDYCFMGNVLGSGASSGGATYQPFLSSGQYALGLQGTWQAGVLYHTSGGRFQPHNAQLDTQNNIVAPGMRSVSPGSSVQVSQPGAIHTLSKFSIQSKWLRKTIAIVRIILCILNPKLCQDNDPPPPPPLNDRRPAIVEVVEETPSQRALRELRSRGFIGLFPQ